MLECLNFRNIELNFKIFLFRKLILEILNVNFIICVLLWNVVSWRGVFFFLFI